MNNLETERKTMLSEAAAHREREVMHYQINIDNYRLALAEIATNHAGDTDLAEFAAQLTELLSSSIREQAKERILLTVIRQQLEAPCSTS
jgi:hypothetical protein